MASKFFVSAYSLIGMVIMFNTFQTFLTNMMEKIITDHHEEHVAGKNKLDNTVIYISIFINHMIVDYYVLRNHHLFIF